MGKAKFNKRKCIKCAYHGHCGGGYSLRIGDSNRTIVCDYSGVTGSTCLKTIDGKTVDLRGDDGEHCKLYKFGTRKTASLPGEL
ncbi:MAG: hypothetical protein J6Y02_08970 [Pseudobutyrivibrio sp.]|nr:hypothetical protein [Pseudobutyrivibrio sp.]